MRGTAKYPPKKPITYAYAFKRSGYLETRTLLRSILVNGYVGLWATAHSKQTLVLARLLDWRRRALQLPAATSPLSEPKFTLLCFVLRRSLKYCPLSANFGFPASAGLHLTLLLREDPKFPVNVQGCEFSDLNTKNRQRVEFPFRGDTSANLKAEKCLCSGSRFSRFSIILARICASTCFQQVAIAFMIHSAFCNS